ncbi:hypothetical protein L1D14_04390 [Vibrio tubiashii]|uniref:hypothetical protein n=1 Tax=Vibrio tubiashii TaxID=29498 RepID=UPI001EFE0170|nr:hypothetical protein [Vibrio tubiashii]MCG9575471.1 hypothetical protein [Vibrio tubiashii]
METIYIIEHTQGSRVPFRIKNVKNSEEALEKVREHMGMDEYYLVGTEVNGVFTPAQ